jgi:hypothetical protein
MDKYFPDGKWSRTFIFPGHMSRLGEWFSFHFVECDLSIIMSDYSDGLWFREMIQLMEMIVMMVLMI